MEASGHVEVRSGRHRLTGLPRFRRIWSLGNRKFTKAITPKGMRRTNKDLMRAAGVRDIVAMAISNHLEDEMHAHYSTVSGAEMTNAVAQVIDLATFRKAHENAADLLAAFATTLPTTRV